MLNPSYPSIRKQAIEITQIPLPPIEEQQKIVNELNRYQKIIDGAKKVIETFDQKMKSRLNNLWQADEKASK